MATERDDWDQLPFERRLRSLAPFLLAFGVAFSLGWLTRAEMTEPLLMALAFGITTLTAAAILWVPWSRLPGWATLGPVVALCGAVYLMRASSGSGSTAGYGALLYTLVVWQAMRRGQRDLVLTILAVTITNIASVAWLPSPSSTQAQWRGVIMSSVVAAMIGETIHALVRERSRLMAEVADLALRDPLTGLGNRRTWDDRLALAAADSSRTGRPLAVAVLDLDHFKAYNDQHGHVEGDELLAGAAAAWNGVLRSSDLLVRWGGEEFALLLPETDDAGAVEILGRLQAVVPSGQSFSAGYTVVSFLPGPPRELDTIVAQADAALYEAKARGRACSVSAADLVAGVADLTPSVDATGSGGHEVGR